MNDVHYMPRILLCLGLGFAVGLCMAPGGLAQPATARPADDDALEYTVSFPQALAQRARVRLSVATGGAERLELRMAVWTPGSYLVREYARHIERLGATDGSGAPLSVVKTDKNHWEVDSRGRDRVVVIYDLYCSELSVRTNWVEREFAVLNGAATFLTVTGRREAPHLVRIDLPDRWKRVVTALPRVDTAAPHTFRARDFDHLVDSPLAFGNAELREFEIGGRPHVLANLGGAGLWDIDRAADDVAKIVREHQRFWGVVPYPRYVFINLIVESGGGLEHDESTLLMTSRWTFRDRKRYYRWLSLVSHEFFHAWNVRRLRPAELTRYDYDRETFFRTLWIAEGVTSYYDGLALVRSGVATRQEFYTDLSRDITRLRQTPGRRVQSLAEASHDTWIKFYRPDENSRNATVSYYTKGAVVAFLLDAWIRRRSEGERSLDDALRALYRKHAESGGFTGEDFRAVAAAAAGSDLSGWFERNVDTAGDLDYQPALEWFGLEFVRAAKPAADNEERVENDARRQPWIGVTTRSDGGRLQVRTVQRDSPAFAAGINADDELIALEGFRLEEKGLPERLKQYNPGDTVTVLLSRRGRVQEVDVTLGEAPRASWKIRPIDDSTAEQKARRERWLSVRKEL